MSESQSKMTHNKNGERVGYLFFAAILAGIVWYFAGMPGLSTGGFNTETIEKIKKSIDEEFRKKGAKVAEVEMLKKNNTELERFAKLKFGDFEVTKACHATYFADDARYIWRCE